MKHHLPPWLPPPRARVSAAASQLCPPKTRPDLCGLWLTHLGGLAAPLFCRFKKRKKKSLTLTMPHPLSPPLSFQAPQPVDLEPSGRLSRSLRSQSLRLLSGWNALPSRSEKASFTLSSMISPRILASWISVFTPTLAF